jgi:hypothetical protein
MNNAVKQEESVDELLEVIFQEGEILVRINEQKPWLKVELAVDDFLYLDGLSFWFRNKHLPTTAINCCEAKVCRDGRLSLVDNTKRELFSFETLYRAASDVSLKVTPRIYAQLQIS